MASIDGAALHLQGDRPTIEVSATASRKQRGGLDGLATATSAGGISACCAGDSAPESFASAWSSISRTVCNAAGEGSCSRYSR
eukprot:6212092-Pleurochrysis_carterae.AAC.2